MRRQNLIIRLSCLVACIFIGLSGYPAYGSGAKEATETISGEMDLPQFKLDAPRSEKEIQYLGLKNSKTFSLTEIPAKLIVLEIFSVYCSHCRIQAGKLNKLYNLIHQNSDLSHAIKMIGISTGANQSKADKWKEALNVPFPLFADPYTEIHKKFGKSGVPYTLIVTNSGKVLSSHTGVTEDVEELFLYVKKCLKQQ